MCSIVAVLAACGGDPVGGDGEASSDANESSSMAPAATTADDSTGSPTSGGEATLGSSGPGTTSGAATGDESGSTTGETDECVVELVPPDCTHFASPDGGGDGSSEASPSLVSEFWPVATAGDTLCLLDGTYVGPDSMIDPPAGLGGVPDVPITVAALHDGQVLLNGESVNNPVYLLENPWFVVEGINACCAFFDPVSVRSPNVVIRRVVGWDAFDGNSNVFSAHYDARDVLFEDCAGFGVSRKVFSPSQSQGSITFRRVFARLEYNTWGGNLGMTAAYNTNDGIVENAIVTVDTSFGPEPPSINLLTYFGEDRDYDTNNQVRGIVVYHTAAQTVATSSVLSMLRPLGSDREMRDVLVVADGPEDEYGATLRLTAQLNPTNFNAQGADYSNLTIVGGPGSVYAQAPGGSASGLIVMGADWQNSDLVDIALRTDVGAPPDYVMFWDNATDFNVAPAHFAQEDPQLIQRCGNLLQAGCSERPTVDGEPVGAQIQCRYENAELTNKPLWPWPMNERIRVATCMHDLGLTQAECELDESAGVNVTETVFSLGGGTVPDFCELNRTHCPGE